MHHSTALAGLLLLLTLFSARAEESPDDGPPPIPLDETAVKNLGIETVEAEPAVFEETIFALGRIEVLPGKSAIVSARIEGRAQSVIALPDMKCEAGDELLWVESRQPGDPPPVIRVDAPISGTIAKVNIAPGQPVRPEDSLMEIYDLSTVEAMAAVPEHYAGRLVKDMKARIRLPGFPDKVWEAKLAHTGAVADAAAGTVEAAFHLPNEEGLLRPGMRAEFTIVLSSREDVSSVPLECLQGDQVNRFVFKKDYELPNAFRKVPVVTGARNDSRVEILEGLLPGDEIVTRGAYALAYAGKGSVSLKEALDAAHGHPHNEDGTEMTKEQIAAAAAGGAAGHSHAEEEGGGTVWKITSGVLFLLLVVSSLQRRPGGKAIKPEAA